MSIREEILGMFKPRAAGNLEDSNRQIYSEALKDSHKATVIYGDITEINKLSDRNCDYTSINNAANETMARKSYKILRALVFKYGIDVVCKSKFDKERIELLLQTKFGLEIKEKIFDELSISTGRGLFGIDTESYECIIHPYYDRVNNVMDNVKPIYTKRNRTITSYEIKHGKSDMQKGKEYLANNFYNFSHDPLFARSPILSSLLAIDWKLSDMETQRRLAGNNRIPFYLMSPDYGAVANNPSLLNQFYSKVGILAKELKAALNSKHRMFLSDVPYKATTITQDNKTMDLKAMLEYCDKMIYTSFGVPGSMVGYPQDSSQATIEQFKDNVSTIDIADYRDRILGCANWLVGKVYPDTVFELKWQVSETDETLKLRDQAILVLNNVIPSLTTAGFSISRKSVNNMIKVFDLELEPQTSQLSLESINEHPSGDNFIEKILSETSTNRDDEIIDKKFIRKVFDSKEQDQIFADYKSSINMTNSQLISWKLDERSLLVPEIKVYLDRSIKLTATKRDKWSNEMYQHALSSSYLIRSILELPDGNDKDIELKSLGYDTLKVRVVGKETELDIVFSNYHKAVNMSFSQLESWSKTEYSKLASLSREPITRNLKLLGKNKKDWSREDISGANKTIAYIARAKAIGKGQVTKATSPYGRNEIAMKNWAYDMSKPSRSVSILNDNEFSAYGLFKSQEFRIIKQETLIAIKKDKVRDANLFEPLTKITTIGIQDYLVKYKDDKLNKQDLILSMTKVYDPKLRNINNYLGIEEIYKNIYLDTIFEIAKQNNRNYIGAMFNDDKAKKTINYINDGWVWCLGESAPSGSCEPWKVENDRFKYYLANDEGLDDLTSNGFIRYNNHISISTKSSEI
jgi:hypothetical protein